MKTELKRNKIHQQVNTATYSDISSNDSNTDVTASELEELTDGSETTLHSHAGGGGGETNTASNVGAGVGVYETKVGVDLRFNSLVSANNRMTISEDDPNDEIDFTVNEGNIDHNNLSNYAVGQHRIINDAGESATELWSSSKIAGELHNESHTVASHSDTTATGAELNELTDGSETTLHSHAGGGGITPEYFQARETAGATIDLTTANPPAAEVDVVFNTQDYKTAGFTYNTTTGVLTIGSALNGKIAVMSCQLVADGGSSRTQLVLEVHRNTGGGYSKIAGCRSSDYNSRDGDQNEGATQLANFLVTLATDDTYKVLASANVDSGTRVFGEGSYWSMFTIS